MVNEKTLATYRNLCHCVCYDCKNLIHSIVINGVITRKCSLDIRPKMVDVKNINESCNSHEKSSYHGLNPHFRFDKDINEIHK